MKNHQELKIVHRNYGIADAFPDGVIELNKHLEKYPVLKRSLIQHELKHSRNEKMNRHDWLHDLTTIDQISQWQMMKFMLRHPLSFLQFAPIYYTKKRGLIIDKNLLVIYSILAIMVGGAITIGKII